MKNDTYLADWTSGKITDEELKKLVAHNEFEAYQKLKFTLDHLEMANTNSPDSFEKIQEKIQQKKLENSSTSKVFRLYKWASIAAILIVLIGLYNLLYFSNKTTTIGNSTKRVTLSDNSLVTLNANSSIEYPNLFTLNRKIKLNGEAFFEVKKGSTFEVKTTLGIVKVMGTKFNVSALDDYFEVDCYEGKVSVSSGNITQILVKGQGIKISKNVVENRNNPTEIIPFPSWINGETCFDQISFKNVVEKFKNQYGVKVNYPKKMENKIISGSFSNRNKKVALQSICYPLQLKFTIENPKQVDITE